MNIWIRRTTEMGLALMTAEARKAKVKGLMDGSTINGAALASLIDECVVALMAEDGKIHLPEEQRTKIEETLAGINGKEVVASSSADEITEWVLELEGERDKMKVDRMNKKGYGGNKMNPIPLTDKNFQRILRFYLFETPVRTFCRKKKDDPGATSDQPHPKFNYEFRKVSKRGITFSERGLDGPKLNSLRAAMVRMTGVELHAVDDDVEKNSEEMDAEYIIIKRNENNVSITEGYFYCIRNAFAHGDFDVEGNVYTLKNEAGGKVKGMARLKEDSLLAWIDLVSMDIEEIKRAGKK